MEYYGIMVPVIVGCCFVFATYIYQGMGDDGENNDENKSQSYQPNYFVIFCIGLILGIGAVFMFGNKEESIQTVMKEIDLADPGF